MRCKNPLTMSAASSFSLVVMSSRGGTQRQALTPSSLAALGAPLVRKLGQVLVVERGVRITRVQPRNDHDDLHTETTGLWRARPGLVRIVHRQLEDQDVQALGEIARSEALAEAVLVEGFPGVGELPRDPAVQVIRADELVNRIKSSALIEWKAGQPRPAQGRVELAANLNQIAAALDPVGLRWLPTLALNHVPSELKGAGSADELLERIAFRVLTAALRLHGRRLGARRRGERVPDAILRWSGGAGLLDCKAAQYGYRMEIGDQRALVEYFKRLKREEDGAGPSLEFILVISGEFDGKDDETHPYYQRARNIKEECGATLVYLRAADLVRLAIEVEGDEADPAERERIDWSSVFTIGLPRTDDVTAAWKGIS